MRLLIAEHKAFRVVSRGRRSAREPQDGVYVPVTKVDRWLGNASLKRTVGAGAARTAIRSVPAVRGRGRMPPALFAYWILIRTPSPPRGTVHSAALACPRDRAPFR